MGTRRTVVGLFLVLACGFAMSAAVGRGRPEPIKRQPIRQRRPLARGVTPTARRALLAAAERRLQEHLRQELAADEAQLKTLQTELATEMKAAEAAANADPKFHEFTKRREAILKTHRDNVARLDQEGRVALARRDQNALARIQRSKAAEAERTAKSINELAQRYRATFEAAAQRGGLIKRRIEGVLAKQVLVPPPFHVFGHVIVGDEEPEQEKEPEQPAGQTYAVFTPAFDTGSKASSGSLIAFGSESWHSNGAVSTDARAMYAGSATHSAMAGSYITVPPGYSKVVVVVKMDYNYDVFAGAGGGGAWAVSRLIMAVEGPGAGQVRRTRLKKVIAPLLFWSSAEGSGTKIWIRTFSISGQGGEFLVLAGARSSAGAAVGAGAQATTSGTVRSITVRAQP